MKHRAAHSGERLMQVVKSLVGLIWEMLMGKVKAGEIWLCYVSFSNCIIKTNVTINVKIMVNKDRHVVLLILFHDFVSLPVICSLLHFQNGFSPSFRNQQRPNLTY